MVSLDEKMSDDLDHDDEGDGEKSEKHEESFQETEELSNSFYSKIHRFAMLKPDEEYELARKWREKADPKAADRIIRSHSRLVAKIAAGYRGYGMSSHDLISEGHIGMMQALNRFEPEKGFRFSTYAMWWIKAQIQQFILSNWSLIRFSSSVKQKRLFFNLKRLRSKLDAIDQRDLSPEDLKRIADELDVTEEEVLDVNQRLMNPDHSLNVHASGIDSEDKETEWIEWIADDSIGHAEDQFVENREFQQRKKVLQKSLECLDAREHDIFTNRRLKEPPKTLDELSQRLSLSRERVRQIEVKAFEKLSKNFKNTLHDQAVFHHITSTKIQKAHAQAR